MQFALNLGFCLGVGVRGATRLKHFNHLMYHIRVPIPNVLDADTHIVVSIEPFLVNFHAFT